MSDHAIADYALLSDRHSAALVHLDGSVDWLCLPRFDAPAQFARLLDADGGHFAITPRDIDSIDRAYLPDSLVLDTCFHCSQGLAVLRDALAVDVDEEVRTLGRDAPHLLLRELRCVEGEVTVDLDYQPRPEYGLIRPLLEPTPGGLVTRGGAGILRLSAETDWSLTDCTARSCLRLRAGERLRVALQYNPITAGTPAGIPAAGISETIERTRTAWQTWSHVHQHYEGPWSEMVRHSGRVLQGLGYQPTGAVIAAPTTSLATCIGGSRNWDYRYSWVRDASLTLDALWVAACPAEADRFFDFLGATALIQVREDGELQSVFGIEGEHDLTERELHWLTGWRNSGPVRVGNAAWSQRQLDGYGNVLLAAHRLRGQLADMTETARRFLAEIADAAASRWQEPDHGIWEIRGKPKHYLHSKLMCWAALDRAIDLVPDLFPDGGEDERIERWRNARTAVRQAILNRGWSEHAGAFTQSFGKAELDAAALLLPQVGFLPADDRRVLGTMDAIEARLTDSNGFVYRYRMDDGLPGDEGPFLICTFWLAQVRAMAGQIEQAVRIFERAAACANELGLLAEQVHPTSRELLGNFPQAFSHIGLVNAAQAIGEARKRAKAGIAGAASAKAR